MIIEAIEKETGQNGCMVSAVLRWEAVYHPVRRLYFQTEPAFSDDLQPSAEAFLTAVLLPAIYFGEPRVRLADPVCPELREGLITAMALLHAWHGHAWRPIPLECRLSTPIGSIQPSKPRAALFLSGGVDSLAVLRTNHLRLPKGHPDRYQDGILIHGHDIGGVADHGQEMKAFKRAREFLQPLATECDLTLIPIRTNTRHLMDNHEFWMRYFYSAALAAVGHVLTPRIDRVGIASGNVIKHLRPWGSHPVLDPCYGSGWLQVRHVGLHHTRLERVHILSQWPTAISRVRVCGHNPAVGLNCGRCEKCVRTMTLLEAIGKLEANEAFPAGGLNAASIGRQLLIHDYQLAPYKEALPLLRERRRHDLVRIIRRKCITYQCLYRYLEWADIKATAKYLDRMLLRGALLKYHRRKKASRLDTSHGEASKG
jgi:hypothetical protein